MTTKIWITKYATTFGIIEYNLDTQIKDNLCIIDNPNECPRRMYFSKPFWYQSKPDAIVHANKLRDKMIKSLNKKLKKLKEMKFE